MYEKIVENWLTSTSEVGYQLPLCEVLISRGYSILAVSSHGPGEHGKDIVARDSQGVLTTFQLKAGDIRLGDWRKIRGEVEELVRLPVQHANVDPREPHTPVLVTNGDIRGDAQQSIKQFAAMWEHDGARRLTYWDRGQLLSLFLGAHASYFPTRPRDFRTFVELYVAEFEDRLPRARLATFLAGLMAPTSRSRATEWKRAIESMVLLSSYIIEQYERCSNHVSAMEGWTIVAATIMHVVEREELSSDVFEESLAVVSQALRRDGANLEKEVYAGNTMVGGRFVLADGLVLGSRVSLVLGWLAAIRIIEGNSTPDPECEAFDRVVRREMANCVWIGEADWPSVTCLAMYLDRRLRPLESAQLLTQWIATVLRVNQSQNNIGMPSPYWLHEKVLAMATGLLAPYDREDFSGASYTIQVAMDMLVRRNCRDVVAQAWPRASRLMFCDFRPSSPAAFFLWTDDGGDTVIADPPQPASWTRWRTAARALAANALPAVLEDHFEWCLPFVLTYPHRLNRSVAAAIDLAIGAIADEQ